MESVSTHASNPALAAIFGIISLLYIGIFIVIAIGMWKIFEKAGKPGWAAIIPIYNLVVLLEIVGKPTWWVLLVLFVPCANFIFLIWTVNLLSKSFGQSEGFTVGIFLLPFVFIPILGFNKSYVYLGPSASEAQGLKNEFTNYKNPFDTQNPLDKKDPFDNQGTSSSNTNNTNNTNPPLF